jgi:gamma-glutamylputrescine oxidase
LILQDWWYTTLLAQQYPVVPPLMSDIKTDILVEGGGMTGISAAASFLGSGQKVVLLERNIIGGSSTGRSAGFLTPNSELELSQIDPTLRNGRSARDLGGAMPWHRIDQKADR